MPINKAIKKVFVNNNTERRNQFCIIDLFAGQGGFIAGFNKVGGWEHFLAVEIAEKHCKVLRDIYPDIPVSQEDVASIDWGKRINSAEIDCVIGGPPCQPFSQGNNRRNGWTDPRNGIPTFVQAVKSINPKVFLLENVPRLWGGDQKHHIQELIGELIDFGYTYTDVEILDAADFGAPCHRKRLFVYGTKQPHKWPVKTHKGNPVSARAFITPLLNQREPDGSPLPEWVKPKIKGARGDIIIDCKQGNKMGRQYVSLDEPCFTLVSTQGIRHRIRYKGKYYRMRAPEAAALQGMDPRCTVEGIGNAVNTWQAEAWAKAIKDYLLDLNKK
jgi:DNA (cytosine-5)-methyltransferase 1